jgi:ferredoxin
VIGHLGATAACDVAVVPDLCGAVARRDQRLELAVAGGPLTVVACYPRAVRWLLDAAGLDGDGVEVFNLRTRSADEVIAGLPGGGPGAESHSVHLWDESGEWVPWYPVIDRRRCTSCGQCASFCIFGVYSTSADGSVEVNNPPGCKLNCPACARICPEGAIIFPKLDEAPINGAEIEDEEALRARIKIDADRILGDDVYAALAERRRKARARLLRKQALEKAHAERARCTCTTSSSSPAQLLGMDSWREGGSR